MTAWKLFLDDVRDPVKVSPYYATFDVARTYDEAVALVEKKGCPDFIAFDHDLHPDHYSPEHPDYRKPSQALTGYHFANWLVTQDIKANGKFFPEGFKFYVHSMNPPGKANIEGLLSSYFQFKKDYNRC